DIGEDVIVYHNEGCSECDNTGYKGRIAIIEVLRFDDEIDEMIAARETIGKIKKVLKRKGFETMADDAIRRVVEGITTLDEVSRVIDLTDRL
ncbi:MAG: secretion system protein E, partial [Gammaproteobacteria bacterium]|nr:secretion system protein E [Gammaproteobacteria bacterium]